MPTPRERYRWNARAARYVDQRTGRFVSGVAVRDAVDSALKVNRNRMLSMTNRLRAGRVDLDVWHEAMRESIKYTHLYSAAAAKGGWAQLTQADFGRVGSTVKNQYRYLDAFASDIERGNVLLDGNLLNRVHMYAMSGREVFHLVERADKADAGYTWERNLLSPADHCTGCLTEAAKGKVLIGNLVPLGNRTCRSNCLCVIEYSFSNL